MPLTLPQAIHETNFHFPGQTAFYRGKVRDVYEIGGRYLVMIATDRISAFDVILPRPVPYKGQVLNRTAAHFLDATTDIVPNWVISVPDPNVTIGVKCAPYKVEMVIRGYVAGHAWREYRAGKRSLCGAPLPDGLRENDRLPEPIITPATKAEEGHDEDISKTAIIKQGLVAEANYHKLEKYTRQLFARGSEIAAKQGLILVDTKYEFGSRDGANYLIDEVHTPDSSRYFYAGGYEKRQEEGIPQQQLSKEFVRRWLIEHGFQGKPGQTIPKLSDTFIKTVSQRYVELYERLTGTNFEYPPEGDPLERIEANVKAAIEKLD